jgi:hypothetical protein
MLNLYRNSKRDQASVKNTALPRNSSGMFPVELEVI